jgi:hypothetical protein
MTFRNLILFGAATMATVFLPACSITQKQGAGLAAYQSYDRPTKLPGNPDAVKVKVSLSKQRTYVMEGSEVLLSMPVSVGAPGNPTPTGNFTIFNKVEKKRENTHGYAYRSDQVKKTSIRNKPAGWSFKGTPMPYWCEFKTNYAFHTGWIKHHPCTNGCIRMHENLAPKFYHLVKIGTPVSIAYSQPEDSTVGNIPLPPDSGPLPDYSDSTYTGDGYFKQHKAPKYD